MDWMVRLDGISTTSRPVGWWVCPALAVLAVLATGCGPKPSPVQSEERRMGLDIAAPVQQSGSDWASWWFNRKHLGSLILLANKELNAGAIAENFHRIKLDPTQLLLAERGSVRVYFIGEASAYRNSLCINLDGVGPDSGNPRIIFPDATCSLDLYQTSRLVDTDSLRFDESKLDARTPGAPLYPGDFVDLGTLDAGTRLNFFLINGDMQVFTVDPTVNADRVEHMTASVIEGTQYLLVSFEDLFGGGDRDFSDCVFLVALSQNNAEALIGKLDPWRRLRQLAVLGAIAGILVGGPLTVRCLQRRAQRLRVARVQERAGALIDHNKCEEAVALLRSHAPRAGVGETSLRQLEARALDRMEAVGELVALEAACPDAFHEDERLSLSVARAQTELGQWDTLHRLRDTWRQRETAPWEWLAFDADELAAQDREDAARALVEAEDADAPHHAGLLMRLAVLVAPESAERALALLAQARTLEPDRPDLPLYAARVHERTGNASAAVQAYGEALAFAPRNPFVRDHVAEYFRRRGDMAKAMKVWIDGLSAPSLDLLWLRVAFWCKVVHPMPVDWPEHRPAGALMPLVDLILALPSGKFWNETAFASIAEASPAIENRQEVFWLRLLEALRVKRENEALRLLNLGRFGRKSWHPALEIALYHIVTFRRLGFLDPKVGSPESSSPTEHPLFDCLFAWASGEAVEHLSNWERLLHGEEAFAAAALAAGWFEACLQLRRVPLSRSEYPRWYLDQLAQAIRVNRGEAACKEYETGMGP